jgi:hypothetical protein
MKPVVGIHDGMTFADYCAIEAINKSGLDVIGDESPGHFYDQNLAPDREEQRETPALRLGQAIHCAILEPQRFEREYRITPTPEQHPNALNTHESYKERCRALGIKITGNKGELRERIITEMDRQVTERLMSAEERGKLQFFEDIEAAFYRGGFTAITPDDLAIVNSIKKRVAQSETLKAIMGNALKTERVIVWQDPETKVFCKGRLDCTAKGEVTYLIDFKSAESAGYRKFRKASDDYRLHRQAAFYSWGWKIITGEDALFVFPAYEKKRPFASAFFYATEKFVRAGMKENRANLNLYARCLAEQRWPCYPDELQPLEPMAYRDQEAGMESF